MTNKDILIFPCLEILRNYENLMYQVFIISKTKFQFYCWISRGKKTWNFQCHQREIVGNISFKAC